MESAIDLKTHDNDPSGRNWGWESSVAVISFFPNGGILNATQRQLLSSMCMLFPTLSNVARKRVPIVEGRKSKVHRSASSWRNFGLYFDLQQQYATSTAATTFIFLMAIPLIVGASSSGFQFAPMLSIRFSNCTLALLVSIVASWILNTTYRIRWSTKTPLACRSEDESQRGYPLLAIAQCKNQREQFMVMFPVLKHELLQTLRHSSELCDELSLAWIDRMIDYSVPGGKLRRGLTVVMVFRSLLGVDRLTPYQMARASVLGWVIEFLQASSLVADDIMDQSQTRRSRPCWYRQEDVGMKAINDAFLLKSFAFQIVQRHFEGALRAHLMDLLLDVVHKTEIGQLYDLQASSCRRPSGGHKENNGNRNFDRFTMERYRLIVKYKTSFYSFYLPVAMGCRLAGIDDSAAFAAAKEACLVLGEYYQVQDDFLDCFGDPSTTGKMGTDIQDGKCTWLVVKALEKCNTSQRHLLEEHYGAQTDEHVARVKQLYQELGLIQDFKTYESGVSATMRRKLDVVSSELIPGELFEQLRHKIHNRPK